MAHAYLSFTEADAAEAERIRDAFAQHAISVLGEPEAGRAGPHLPQEVENAIANAFAFIIIISDNALDAPQTRSALDFALANDIPVMPVAFTRADLSSWWLSRLSNTVMVEATRGGDEHLAALISGVGRFSDRLCPVLALMNMKGGVGKTTVAAQVMAALQKRRRNRVVLVDLDPQHNLSQIFLRRSTQHTLIQLDASVISLFEPSGLQGYPSPGDDWRGVNKAEIAPPEPDLIARRLIKTDSAKERFDLICGQFDIAKYAFLETKADIDAARGNFMRAIDALRAQYDLVVLDTNPSASFLTRCAFGVASRILAPVRPDRFSLRGLRLLNEIMTRLLDEPGRAPISVIFNGVDRAQMTEIEQTARDGGFDAGLGFALSRSVLKHRLINSKFLTVREEGMEDDPLAHLAIYRASGLWAGPLKDSLTGIAEEVCALMANQTAREAA